MTTRTRLAVAALAAAAVPLTLAGPASAESVTVSDPTASQASTDIHWVKATHAEKRVYVQIAVDDIPTPDEVGGGGAKVFYDINRNLPGPERVLFMPLTPDSDWQLLKMRDWKAVGDPLNCATSVGLNASSDVASTRVARNCLGKPGKVRVAVKTSPADGSPTDWLIGKRKFTRWLERA